MAQYPFDDLLYGKLRNNPCPSGKGHQIVERVVITIRGNKYCLHPDCVRANIDEIDPPI